MAITSYTLAFQITIKVKLKVSKCSVSNLNCKVEMFINYDVLKDLVGTLNHSIGNFVFSKAVCTSV